jgi:hypothetical protein
MAVCDTRWSQNLVVVVEQVFQDRRTDEPGLPVRKIRIPYPSTWLP